MVTLVTVAIKIMCIGIPAESSPDTSYGASYVKLNGGVYHSGEGVYWISYGWKSLRTLT